MIGDSQSIVKAIVDNFVPKDLRFARLVKRIKSMSKTLQRVNFFHVLRENNKDADIEASKATLLSTGTSDREDEWVPIP